MIDKPIFSIGFAFGKICTSVDASNSSTEELTTLFSQVNSTIDKLKLCRNFQTKGTCPFGSSCHFAHETSLKNLPCKFYFSASQCKFGDKCMYSHSKEVLANWLQHSSISFQKHSLNHSLWQSNKHDFYSNIKKIQVFNFLSKKLLLLTFEGRVFFAELVMENVNYQIRIKEELQFPNKELIQDFSCANNIYIGAYALFVSKSNIVYGFGINGFGNLGTGTFIDCWTPTIILKQISVCKAICGLGHSLFLLSNGTVLCCGNNEQGQLGLGIVEDKVQNISKIEVLESVTVEQIAIGSDHSLFLTTEGQVYGCGSNQYGEIGLGPQIRRMNIPVAIQAFFDGETVLKTVPIIKEILCNPHGHFTIFRTKEDEFFVCGKNSYGNLSIPHKVRKQIFYPTKVKFTIPQQCKVEKCFVGKNNFVVVVRKGNDSSIQLYCCGDNDSNQIMIQSNNRRFEDALNVDCLSQFESQRMIPAMQAIQSSLTKWEIQQLIFLDTAMLAVATLQPWQKLQENLWKQKYFVDVSFFFKK